MAALSQAGSSSLGPGREGEVEKRESREVEGAPWAERGRGEKSQESKTRKGLLQILVQHVMNKQHFVTIVTVTIYLTQVYIHFYLCNLCPSPTIHNCCAHGEDCAITQIRANTDKRAYLLTARRVGPTNSSSHRSHWMAAGVTRHRNV